MKDPASKPGAVAKPRRVKPSRAEKKQQVHASLLHAAAKVIGREGYANAMVATITAEAEVAQGTFYNYFESRQDLFDMLLPALGREMLDFVRDEAFAASSALDREERSFRAFFSFLRLRPEFYRMLYEAELFAPKAFQTHMDAVATAYVRTLERAAKRGELKETDHDALEATAYMLMGIRHYLCMRYARQDGQSVSLPEWVVQKYIALISDGLFVK